MFNQDFLQNTDIVVFLQYRHYIKSMLQIIIEVTIPTKSPNKAINNTCLFFIYYPSFQYAYLCILIYFNYSKHIDYICEMGVNFTKVYKIKEARSQCPPCQVNLELK